MASLRRARERTGLTQQEVADRLSQLAWCRDRIRVGVTADMVSKWERGSKRPSRLYRELLGLLYDATPADLGLVSGAAPAQSDCGTPAGATLLIAGEQWGELFVALGDHGRLLMPRLARQWEDELVRRRELLKAMGLASVAAAVGGALPPGVGKQSLYAVDLTPDAPTLDGLADLAARYQALYHSVPPRTLITPVLAHLGTVDDLLRQQPKPPVRTALLDNYSQVAVLAGRLSFFDLRDPRAARGYFSEAYDAGVAAADPALVAAALGHLSFVPAAAGHVNAARDHLQHARARAATRAHPRLHSWLAAVTSEVSSNAGDHTSSLRAIEDANRLLHASDSAQVPPWFDYYDGTRLAGFAGYALLRAGKPREAANSLKRAITGLPVSAVKQRAIFQLDLASVYALEQDIDEACGYATDVTASVSVHRYATALERLRLFRQQLKPFEKSAAVRSLDQQLVGIL